MTNKLPCEVIQDLFPSYIDGLTSEVTNTLVDEHIEECSKCKEVLEVMKEPQAKPVDLAAKQEIDFLKKTRKRTHRIVVGSILTAAFVVVVVLVAKFFFLGNYISGEAVTCEIQVDGNHLTLSGATVDDGLGIASVVYAQKDGVVTLSFKAVKESIFHKGEFYSEYTADSKITQVCIGSRIIWARGEAISAIASAVYNTRHAYIGNMPENGQTAKALNMTNYLGGYTNELQTGKEPYAWKMVLEEEVSALQQEKKEQCMKFYAYILMAVIDNLGEVSFEYTVDGTVQILLVVKDEASAFAGRDIKKCGKDILLLQDLIKKTGFDTYAYINDDSKWCNQESISLKIVNNTEEEIAELKISYYLNGKLYGTQGGANADGTLLGKGEMLYFSFVSDDFDGKQWNGEEELVMEFSVHDKEGKEYEIEEPVHMPAKLGVIYNYSLAGNTRDGFVIRQ